MFWTTTTVGEAGTWALGRRVGAAAEPGLVIGLDGPLGAGKTRFVQGVAEGLAADRTLVNSPTFVLLQIYDGRLPIYHFDAYRLKSSDEFLDLGVDEIFASGGVCLIEWASRVADVLPTDRLNVVIELAGDEQRRLTFTAGGPQAERLMDALA